ncbi:MAG: SIMPL domain-containing protein [Candidatus Pacebacteria bacterium]|jgi:hypothetical protein|nr:SIMPL domain-containing protein [Candidatus Paceibacterota bacterium]
MQQSNKSFALWLGLLIGGSLLVSSVIFALTLYRARTSDNALSVTGSATTEVVSDTVRWTGSFTRTAKLAALKTGYEQMAKDLTLVREFLLINGIAESDVTVSTIFMNQDYSSMNQNVSASEREYILNQTIEINSTDVAKITALAKNVQSLIDKGVIFSSNPLEYYYSNLPETRVALLSDALKDAKARAQKIAETTGDRVGALQSASSGVVQVLSPNSVDVSDYGAYDTASLNKSIMVTVKASFNLR